jgi:hypothetical protein
MRGMCRKMTIAGFVVCSLFLTLSCSQENRPFQAKYLSPNQVLITYQGKQYTLNRYGVSAQTPFQYRFEPDGDLDLFIGGSSYDVDSPYDIDRKKYKKSSTKKKQRRRQ